jgi:hypothetical protein
MFNYGKTKYSADTQGISFNGDNEEIRKSYSSVINYRLGAEKRYNI